MVAPGYEICDDGDRNGPTDGCSTTCKINVQ
jgi:cysteine-rich repeat protein